MSRIVLLLGIVLIVVGIAGMVVGVSGVGGNFTNLISNAVNPTAAELCEPGETLDEETGSQEYTAFEGYRRSVRYFCVDADGERREVTGDFVQDMFGQAFGAVPTLFMPLFGGCALTLGIILTIAGAIFSARRRAVAAPTYVTTRQPYGFDFPADEPVARTPRSARRSSPAAGDDLVARLRQLEEAHKSGLITDEEYERKRQQILDSMQ